MGEFIGLMAVVSPFLMVFGIIWIKSRNRLEEKRLAATADLASEKAAQYTAQTAELEQRVRVLERIVTDSGYRVSQEIETLRNVPETAPNPQPQETV